MYACTFQSVIAVEKMPEADETSTPTAVAPARASLAITVLSYALIKAWRPLYIHACSNVCMQACIVAARVILVQDLQHARVCMCACACVHLP